VRLLVDAKLSPVVSERLRDAGHEAIHVFDVGMARASDESIVEYALEQGYVIISADADFAAILARLDRAKPSFVLLRHVNEMTPEQYAALLRAISTRSPRISQPARSRHSRAARFRVRRLPFSNA